MNKWHYIEGPGQRYVGVGDVLIWLCKKSLATSDALIDEIAHNNNEDVKAILKARRDAIQNVINEFMLEHQIGTTEIFKGDK